MTISHELTLEGLYSKFAERVVTLRDIFFQRVADFGCNLWLSKICVKIYILSTRENFLFCYHTNEIKKLFMTQLQSNTWIFVHDNVV